jgi:hypothetical protein
MIIFYREEWNGYKKSIKIIDDWNKFS